MDYIEQIPSTDLMYGPGGNLLKVVIVPTPLDAQVIIEAGEYVPINNVVYVPSGTSITYTVVKNGYISKSETVVVTESQNIYVELEKEQENMIYGWSTGVSESWSTPFDLGVYAFSRSLYANNRFYMLDTGELKIGVSISGTEGWKVVDITSSLIQYYSGIAYGNSKLMLCGYNTSSKKSFCTFLENGILETPTEIEGIYPVNDLIYADGKFVAVGAGRAAVTLDDGLTWSLSNEIAGEALIKVIYGNGKFVAGCLSGKLFVSEDGINWIEGSQVFSDLINVLTYGNGKFVAWEGKNVSTSEDGINWSNPVLWAQLSGAVNACTYGNGKFIAISYQGVVLSSEDGINWNAAGDISAHQWTTACYGNGKFVASGDEGYFSFLGTQTFYSQVENPVADDYLFDSDGNIISRIVDATEYKAWEFSKDGINFTGYTTSIYPSSGDIVYSDTSKTTSFTVEGLGTFTLTVGSCDYKSITVIPSTAYNWISAIQDGNLGSYSWRALAYDGSKFVALDYDGYISTSTDGTTWTEVVVNLDGIGWYTLAYDGIKFMALGYGGYVSTSTDGITWTEAAYNSNLDNHTWTALAYDGSKFVALDYDGYVSTSTDGIIWTEAAVNLDGEGWHALAYDGIKFVALEDDGYVSTSTNGITWAEAVYNSNLGNHAWLALAYDGSKFMALGYGGYVSTSTDGITWTEAAYNSNLGNHAWAALAYDGSKFVALDYDGYVSACRAAMKMKRDPQIEETTSLNVQSYVNIADWKIPTRGLPVLDDSDKNEWFGLAYDGYKYVALNKLGYISTSVDGEIWTQPSGVPNLGDTHEWQYLLYDGLKYIALAADGYISTSTDGVTWGSAASTLGAHSWENMTFNGTTYVAVSATGWRATSSDGINWNNIVQDSNLGNYYWYALTYGNGKFVALGRSCCAYSTDNGTLWQRITVSNLANHTWNGVVWDGTKFLAVATDGYVSASLNGTTWDSPAKTSLASNASARENNDWDKIIYDGKRLLAVSQEGYVSTGTRVINRDNTLDKVSKNKTQYFTVTTNQTHSIGIIFDSINGELLFPNPILIEWGDGSSERVGSSSTVVHDYSDHQFYQIKIISESGLLPDIRDITGLYSWDSVLLPMIAADGVTYAKTCNLFKGGASNSFKSICSSPFQNSVYKDLGAAFYSQSYFMGLSINNLREAQADYFTLICSRSGLRTADFSKLNYATSAFSQAFDGCSQLNDVNFDSLISVYNNNFSYAFRNCPSLTSVVFPVLESIQGSYCFYSAFRNDINLTEVKFPSLKYINGGSSVFNGAFANTAVTDLYFPSLSPVNVNNGQFNRILEGNSNLRIHLPINLEGKFSVGKFVAISQGGYVSTSEDGVTWSQAVQNSNLGDKHWHSLSWDGTKFVALDIDGYISNSVDGETWVQAAQDSELISNEWQALAYDSTKFVALSQTGYVSTSTDGITWTEAVYNNNLGSRPWEALTYGGTKFVALTYDGYVSTSTDGIIWTQATYDSNLGFHFWKDVAYDGVKFVALGDSGHISTSIDGTTWDEAVDIIDRNGWYTLAYDGTKFVALTYDGYVSTSTDGVVWTSATYESTLGNKVWGALAFKNNFVYDLPPSEE